MRSVTAALGGLMLLALGCPTFDKLDTYCKTDSECTKPLVCNTDSHQCEKPLPPGCLLDGYFLCDTKDTIGNSCNCPNPLTDSCVDPSAFYSNPFQGNVCTRGACVPRCNGPTGAGASCDDNCGGSCPCDTKLTCKNGKCIDPTCTPTCPAPTLGSACGTDPALTCGVGACDCNPSATMLLCMNGATPNPRGGNCCKGPGAACTAISDCCQGVNCDGSKCCGNPGQPAPSKGGCCAADSNWKNGICCWGVAHNCGGDLECCSGRCTAGANLCT